MKLVTPFLFSLLTLPVFVACSTKPAVLPNALPSPESEDQASFNQARICQSKELELAQKAAHHASNSAKEAAIESEKVQRQIAELKSEVQKLSLLASSCSDLAKKSDQKRAAFAAKLAKKEAEEKKAKEEAAVALPAPTAKIQNGEYSKSDAPPGYYPEVGAAKTPPVVHDKH